MLSRHTARVALASSIAWAAGVWVLGEGLGGLLSGPGSVLAGAPGAALLYATFTAALALAELVIALAALWPGWPRRGSGRGDGRLAVRGSPRRAG